MGLSVAGGGGLGGGEGGALYTGLLSLASEGILAAQCVGTVKLRGCL